MWSGACSLNLSLAAVDMCLWSCFVSAHWGSLTKNCSITDSVSIASRLSRLAPDKGQLQILGLLLVELPLSIQT